MFANEFLLTSRGRRRAARISLKPLVLAMSLAGVMGAVHAVPAVGQLPTGVVVQTGQATIATNADAARMDINQTSSNAALTANTFSVGANAKVNINGPSSDSNTLIRVTGGAPSEIYGTVFANNHLWLVNGSGIYVGSTGSISASSLLLSARDVDPGEVSSGYASFMARKRVPFLAGAGSNDYGGGFIKIDAGATVEAREGGLVMIAPNYIFNQGTVTAHNGGDLTMLVGNSAEVEIGDSGYIVLSPLLDSTTGNTNGLGRALYNGDKGVISSDDGHVQLIVAGSGNDGITVSTGQDTMSGGTAVPPINGVLNDGTVSAQTTNGNGSVLIQVVGQNGFASNQGTVIVNGLGESSTAGTINIVAPNINIGTTVAGKTALLSADGALGGGQINLAVSSGGASSAVNTLLLNNQTLITANARDTGNGGSIKVLGAPNVNGDTSNAYGSSNGLAFVQLQGVLRAQGGTGGGNGGQIIASGSMVNARVTSSSVGTAAATTTTTKAQIDVSPRNDTGKAGTFALYSPQVLIGSVAALDKLGGNSLQGTSSLVYDEDLNTILSTGANVHIGTYSDGITFHPSVEVLDGTHIKSGFSGAQELAIDSVDSIYLGRADSGGAQIAIQSGGGPLSVKLTADSDLNGTGDLSIAGLRTPVLTSVPGRATAQATSTGSPVVIETGGGDITVTGRSTSVATTTSATDDAVVVDNVSFNAGAGKVTITGAGGSNTGEGTSYFNGVRFRDAVISAGNITVHGESLAATGVQLTGTVLSTIENATGKIDISGSSVGAPTAGTHIGVDAPDLAVSLGSKGELKLAGLATGGSDANGIGLQIGNLNVATRTATGATDVARVTLVGQSSQSSQPGLQVNQGVFINNDSPLSNVDVVIGAKADKQADQALNLGASFFKTSGHINVRPMQVDSSGALSEDTATAIHIGVRPNTTSFPTNFIVSPDLFNGNMGSGLNVIVGSSLHAGRITTDSQVFVDPTATATLQNQGTGSGGIEVGAQGGQVQVPAAVSGRAQALATRSTSAGILNLVSGGNITQTGPIVAQAVNVVTTRQASVTLNNPGNQIGSMLISGGGQVSIPAGATPSSTGAITVFDAAANQFRTIQATGNTTPTPPPEPTPTPTINPAEVAIAIAPSISTVESSEALGELRTDVYVRGQFTRPQVCTPANTGGGVASDLEADPLAQQWLQVRRSAQLSSCSSVRNDSNCSAF